MDIKKEFRNLLIFLGLIVIIPVAPLSFGGTQYSKNRIIHNEWKKSKHSQTQKDVAKELANSRVGQTPAEVIGGPDAENCIGCHGPTAVLANGGMTEARTLAYFFTTKNGKFTAKTKPSRMAKWPGVSCAVCHNPKNPTQPVYFNSATKQYETIDDSSKLCGMCHGNLRFPGTDHLSYNIIQGTGGVGVPDQKNMAGTSCTDCHMYNTKSDSSNYFGHTLSVIVKKKGSVSASCTNCHSSMDAKSSSQTIAQWKEDFQNLDAQAQDLVGKATEALKGSSDSALLSKLDEAEKNLTYAESDESGGVHNHEYLLALLNDSIARAQEILADN